MNLPAGQKRVWDAISDEVEEMGRMPSTALLRRRLGISRNSLIEHLAALEKKGLLHVNHRGRRFEMALELTTKGKRLLGLGVQVLGSIPAGSLNEADTEWRGLLRIPGSPGLFGLFVDGLSNAERLLPGDLVLLRKYTGQPIGKRQFVAVREGDRTTLKYVERKGDRVILRPHNPDFEPTELALPDFDLSIQAIHDERDGLVRGQRLIAALLEVDM